MFATMSSGKHTAGHPSGLGLVFTDARGRIVFVDNSFLELVGQGETHRLVGEPFHKAIRATQDVVVGLIREIAQLGYVHEHPLTITRETGEQIETVCTGVATYDDQNIFIGADLSLRNPSFASPAETATHSDVLGARIQQIEAEADQQIAEDRLLAQLYFTAQAGALLILLGRMGGQRVQELVEEIVNQRASSAGWPIQIKAGQFVIAPTGLPDEAYRTLLSAMIEYGRNIVGGRMLQQELRAVDALMKPAAQQVAEQAGLRRNL
jgi:hypothetical protein